MLYFSHQIQLEMVGNSGTVPVIHWMTNSVAPDQLFEFVHCGCKKHCGTQRCSCFNLSSSLHVVGGAVQVLDREKSSGKRRPVCRQHKKRNTRCPQNAKFPLVKIDVPLIQSNPICSNYAIRNFQTELIL